ncbi:MAG: YfhO family protein [Candidatus Levybacteria bacterium]|nr:YfhO family protein [Candidatus Levybacteria bacterium]
MAKSLVKYFPILIIIFVWLIFSSQYFLKGAAPFPSTYLLNNFDPWNEYDIIVGPVKNGATPDVITQIYPWKWLVIDSFKSGNFPLWNPYAFSGTPLLANYQSAVLSPLNLLYFTFPFNDAWSISILLQPLLASLFMFLYLKSIKRSEFASTVAAIAFGFCGFIASWMMYGTLGFAILYLPASLFAIEKFYATKKWQYLALLSISLPLSFFSGHFQTSLYFLIFVFLYSFFKFLTKKDKRLFGFTFFSMILGLMMASLQLLPSIEFYLNSPRQTIYSISEIIPWAYIATFFAPDFFGNPVTRNDWFGHYIEWNAYIGLIPLLLGFYAFRKKDTYVYFFGLMSLVVLFFAFKSPIQDLLLALKVPVLSTSAAGRIIVLFSFSAAALSSFGVDHLLEDIKQRKFKLIFLWVGLMLLIFGLLWSLILFKIYLPPENIHIAFSNLRLPTAILGAFLLLLFFSMAFKSKKIALLLPLGLIALVSFDMLRFSLKWMPFEDKKLIFPSVTLSEGVKRVAPQDRIIATFGNEGSGILKIASTEGYDPLYIESYGEFVRSAEEGGYKAPERSVVRFPRVSRNSEKLLNFLGVRYLVHKKADSFTPWTYPYWDYPQKDFKLIYEDEKYQVFDNLAALPRTFAVGRYKVISDKEKAIEEIYKEETDLSEEVILSGEPINTIEEDENPQISIVAYSPNLVRIQTQTNKDSILVLTDPYYPGWKAFIDNKKTRILVADHAFRAIELPKGEHIVNFIYSPESVKVGFILFIFGIFGVLGLRYLVRKP